MPGTIAIALGAGAVSALITGVVLRLALHKQLVDVPNARSSHSVPTPSMGGIGLVTVVIAGIIAAGFTGALLTTDSVVLAATSGTVALVGLIDDWRGLPAKWRLLVQVACAGVLLAGIDSALCFEIGPWTIENTIVGKGLALLFIVWLTNLYNFMDGIDGLAAVEAISVASAATIILSLSGGNGPVGLYLLIAAAVAGFAIWNWPPAKIFMGDTGSAFLGFLFGGLAVLGDTAGGLSVWTWIILLSVFVTDATFTLCRRFATGQRAYEAHRSHAYQRLARRFKSHRTVTVGVLIVNAFVLFPLAWWVHANGADGAVAALVIVGVLAAVAALAGAGRPDGER